MRGMLDPSSPMKTRSVMEHRHLLIIVIGPVSQLADTPRSGRLSLWMLGCSTLPHVRALAGHPGAGPALLFRLTDQCEGHR